MTLLDATKESLINLAADPEVPMVGVWYGACQAEKLDHWNYFVFNRDKTTKSSNRMDVQTYLQVHIVHEDYIPEGYVEKVIETLEAQKAPHKLKLTSNDIEYNYTFKSNTNMVVEMATITFYHPEKRC